jgi:anti-sigma factor NepR-like protein
MTQRKLDTQLDPDVQAHIGRQLRAGYVGILNQPVPDRFLELLAELDKRESEESDVTDNGLLQNGSR